jgi:hypothetical protein
MRHRAVCLVKLKIDIFYLAAVWNDCLQVHTIHGFCNFLSFCGLASYSLFIHGRWFQDHDYLSSFIFSSFLFRFSSLITFPYDILNGIKTALKLDFRLIQDFKEKGSVFKERIDHQNKNMVKISNHYEQTIQK